MVLTASVEEAISGIQRYPLGSLRTFTVTPRILNSYISSSMFRI